ncbi:MAG: hypothetical protein L3J66_01865 [Bacteroidales bacterium]|nr:hypothetical protein [Bacteroidales bacterium]
MLAPGDYLIFGLFYGECFGEEWIEIFSLEKVKGLMVYFPDSLLLDKDRVIGQPDTRDWGGTY